MDHNVDLKNVISQEWLCTVSTPKLLKMLEANFSPEFERLKNIEAVERDPSVQRKAVDSQHAQSPSKFLYNNEKFDEIDRTVAGLLILGSILNGDYEVFTSAHSPGMKLRRESFENLQVFFRDNIKTNNDLYALCVSMVVNDLGKDAGLKRDFDDKYPKDKGKLDGQNHDVILLAAADAGMIPCLERLQTPDKDDIMLGLRLGSEFNAGQLAQAENVPANLHGLLKLRGQERAFRLKFLELILDVAGAAAHDDPRGASSFIEPVFQAYMTVYEVSLKIVNEECDLRQGYDQVLMKRSNMLVEAGFRHLDVEKPYQRALLRLMAMGRTATKERAKLFYETLKALDSGRRRILVYGLNVDGLGTEKAALFYYLPAVFAALWICTASMKPKEQRTILKSLLLYMTRVIESVGKRQNPGTVVEYDVRHLIVLFNGQISAADLIISDDVEIPEGKDIVIGCGKGSFPTKGSVAAGTSVMVY